MGLDTKTNRLTDWPTVSCKVTLTLAATVVVFEEKCNLTLRMYELVILVHEVHIFYSYCVIQPLRRGRIINVMSHELLII
jgi:hypothetical protein